MTSPASLHPYLSGLWWPLLVLTFCLSGEADPRRSGAAHLVVGYHSQLVVGVRLETLEAGPLPWPHVLCLRVARSTGNGRVRRASHGELELIARMRTNT